MCRIQIISLIGRSNKKHGIAIGAVLFVGCAIKATEPPKTQTPAPTPTTPPVAEKKAPSYYYTANEGGSILKIDAATNKVVDTFKTDGNTHNVQVSPNGKILGATVAVSMEKKNEHGTMNMKGTALFYDTETNQLINKVEVGVHPAHIVFTPDGKYSIITNNEDNNLYVIDMSSYKVVNQVYIQSDDKFAFVANQGTEESPSNTVSKVDLTTKTVVATIEAGKGAHGVVTSDDNKYVYITNMYENTVSVIDNASNKVIATVPVDKEPNGISYKK
jgi:YVTN family beta-propeller protein